MINDRMIDWTTVIRKHPGQWVAFAEDEQTVLAAGHTAKEVLVQSAAKGLAAPLLYRVPDTLDAFAGYGISV